MSYLLSLANGAAAAKKPETIPAIYDSLIKLDGLKQSKGYLLWKCGYSLDPKMGAAFRDFIEPRLGAVGDDTWKIVNNYYLAGAKYDTGKYDEALDLYLSVTEAELSAFHNGYPGVARPEKILADANEQVAECLRSLGDRKSAERIEEMLDKQQRNATK